MKPSIGDESNSLPLRAYVAGCGKVSHISAKSMPNPTKQSCSSLSGCPGEMEPLKTTLALMHGSLSDKSQK